VTAAIRIYEGQEFYVPHFEVKLNGRPAGKDIVRDIISVTYSDNIAEIDTFEITINNWDADTLSFKYSDADLFDPGKEVELWMGYYGKDRLQLMITGEITALRPTFPAGGPPTLAVSGLNLLHRLRTKQESRAYTDLTDSQIARQIGQRMNIEIVTDPEAAAGETPYEYLFQDNQYSIIFLMERARRIGYDLFVAERGENGQAQPGQVYFSPSQHVRRPTYELTYGKSLIEFQPTLTTANQVGQVTVRGWDPRRKRKIEHTAKRSDIATRGVGSGGGQAVIEQSFNQREEIIADRPIESKAEARRLAEETLERIAKDMIKGSGSVVGLPDLRAGTVLHIDGLGKRFSGRYFVTATTHSIGDSGYTTRFECRREELN
jgi:uncharacterized protein